MEKIALMLKMNDDTVPISWPQDLVMDIVTRLPVKSLLRFKCIGKDWSTLFQTSKFIDSHYSHKNSEEGKKLLFLNLENGACGNPMFLLSSETLETKVQLCASFTLETDDLVLAVGTCNGIICLTQGFECIFFWNPAIRETKVIPFPKIDTPRGITYNYTTFGFGYDSITGNYKIVAFVQFEHSDYYENDVLNTEVPSSYVEMYNLKNDLWKKLYPDIFIDSHGIYLDGKCHWLAEDDSYSQTMLVSLDLNSEVFQKTLLGPNMGRTETLVVLNQSVAVVSSTGNDSSCFDFYILGELGNEHSWTKYFTIRPFPSVYFTVVGTGTQNRVFFIHDHGELACYDFRNNVLKKMCFTGDFAIIQVFVESLVSPLRICSTS